MCTVETGQVCKSREQLQPAATAICIPGLGSNFLLVVVGISYQSWLSLCICHGWLLVFFQNHSLSRLRCSGVASAYGWVKILLYCLWLNEHIHYFLTHQSKSSIFISQSKYAYEILKRFNMINSKSSPTPIIIGLMLSKEDEGYKVDPTLLKGW
jgi:hypothetical protein